MLIKQINNGKKLQRLNKIKWKKIFFWEIIRMIIFHTIKRNFKGKCEWMKAYKILLINYYYINFIIK